MPRYIPRYRQKLIYQFMKLGRDKNAGGPTKLAANIWGAFLDGLIPESALPQFQKNGNIPDIKPPAAPAPEPPPAPVEDYARLREFQEQIYGGGHNERANTGTTSAATDTTGDASTNPPVRSENG